MPVVSSRHSRRVVHSLLHDGPFAISRQDERVQVKLKSVGDGIVINSRRQSTCSDEALAVGPDPACDSPQLVRCLTRLLASSAADINAQLFGTRFEAPLQ